MEDAIREGIIYWHAFPFNAQLEFMDEELLRSSVRLTHDLDARFGLAPKCTLSQVGGAATPSRDLVGPRCGLQPHRDVPVPIERAPLCC